MNHSRQFLRPSSCLRIPLLLVTITRITHTHSLAVHVSKLQLIISLIYGAKRKRNTTYNYMKSHRIYQLVGCPISRFNAKRKISGFGISSIGVFVEKVYTTFNFVLWLPWSIQLARCIIMVQYYTNSTINRFNIQLFKYILSSTSNMLQQFNNYINMVDSAIQLQIYFRISLFSIRLCKQHYLKWHQTIKVPSILKPNS